VKKAASKSLFLNKKKNDFLRKREIFNILRNKKPERRSGFMLRVFYIF
jgi:hypothetical protein